MMTVNLKAPYNNSLIDAHFTATCDFSDDHIQMIEKLVKQKAKEWMEKVRKLMDTLHSHVDSL